MKVALEDASLSACNCSILAYRKTDVSALAAASSFVASVGSDSDIADLIAALQPGSVVAADGLYAGMANILPDVAQQVCTCTPTPCAGLFCRALLVREAMVQLCDAVVGLAHGRAVSYLPLPSVQLQLHLLAAWRRGRCTVSSRCRCCGQGPEGVRGAAGRDGGGRPAALLQGHPDVPVQGQAASKHSLSGVRDTEKHRQAQPPPVTSV